jgi:hypothetical protein
VRLYFGFSDIPVVVFYSYVVWSWYRWARSSEEVSPKWRFFTAIAGFCVATVSTALSAFIWIHSIFTGGFSLIPASRIELFCIAAGSLTALLGLVASLLGKGRLRLPTAIASVVNLCLWFLDANSF